MDNVKIASVDPKVFKNKTPSVVDQFNAEEHCTYFLDHLEYPEEGGVLAYKYGGEVIQGEGPTHKFFCNPADLDELGKKEFELGYLPKNQTVMLCRSCNTVEVHFIPRMEVLNRVDLLYPEKGFTSPEILAAIVVVSVPVMVLFGHWLLHKASPATEYASTVKGSVYGYKGVDATIETAENIRKIYELLVDKKDDIIK